MTDNPHLNKKLEALMVPQAEDAEIPELTENQRLIATVFALNNEKKELTNRLSWFVARLKETVLIGLATSLLMIVALIVVASSPAYGKTDLVAIAAGILLLNYLILLATANKTANKK